MITGFSYSHTTFEIGKSICIVPTESGNCHSSCSEGNLIAVDPGTDERGLRTASRDALESLLSPRVANQFFLVVYVRGFLVVCEDSVVLLVNQIPCGSRIDLDDDISDNLGVIRI